MSRRRGVLGAAIAALVLSACGGDGDGSNEESAESSATTTEPVITAPPTVSAEEQAEAEIIATFEGLIAAWDEFKSNASDYGGVGDETWNAELVATWSVEAQANLNLTNWVAAWRNTGVEQVGITEIREHVITETGLEIAGEGVHAAKSTACLDMTDLAFVDYEGSPAGEVFQADQYQRWTMSWTHRSQSEQGDRGDGWYVQSLDLTRNEPC